MDTKTRTTSARSVPRPSRWLGAPVFALGAMLLAIGVGLVPHLAKRGLNEVSVAAIALVLLGVSAAIVGVVVAVSQRRRWIQVVVGVAATLTVGMVVSVVAPAVAVTHVPRAAISVTPDALGLDHRDVMLSTTDGVELAAWYVEGTNGGAVVVMHGAGSTRSDVLDASAALSRAGYAVLLVDARGHGKSGGRAMDFGWYGDLDIAAGVDFVSVQPDVLPDRIGVVGFSMGGEQAIGAAAADVRIRAVVAEGATARQAADKAWMSDVYGWRGWVQEQLEKVQYGITDVLTSAAPPIALRAAASAATHTRFLLITSSEVADEGHAARYIQSGASDRVTVWSIEGVPHTGGFDHGPAEWTQRVGDFLDGALAPP